MVKAFFEIGCPLGSEFLYYKTDKTLSAFRNSEIGGVIKAIYLDPEQSQN